MTYENETIQDSRQIQYVSDLHLEEQEPAFLPEHVDQNTSIVVFAGDISDSPQQVLEYFKSFPSDIQIVYVLGNHEFFNHDWNTCSLEYKNVLQECKNVHLLDNESKTINGILFFGTTLWSDFFNGTKGPISQDFMPEYSSVWNGERMLVWTDVLKKFKENLDWLKKQIVENSHAPTVVVTHHAPSLKSNSLRFSKSSISGAFCNNLDSWVQKQKINAWIHGHTHNSSDYNLGQARILANPKGFFEENPKFNAYRVLKL